MVGLQPPSASANDRARHFASRPWTQAEDDTLRCLALKGLSSTAIGVRMNRAETDVHSRARQMQVILRKIRPRQLQMG